MGPDDPRLLGTNGNEADTCASNLAPSVNKHNLMIKGEISIASLKVL